MTWTYSDPAGSNRDAVRFRVGDTDTSDQQLTDEEIAYLITSHSTVDAASIAACEHLEAKYARQADFTNGRLSVAAGKRSEAYRALAADLRTRLGYTASWFSGGQTISGKDSLSDDSDAVQPSFSVGMNDFATTNSNNDD